ncbi:NnrU family protein [Arhodomonas sp. SL1]|uniref:NnrU family protein n=1 Tax=Arhodomonas sp. SL1 TaxID=3425691 RepID=UPI003F8848E1
MGILILGLILFLGVHSVSIVAPEWRDRMVGRFGEMPWKGMYSVVAIVGVVLIIWGYGAARQDPVFLYVPPTWLRHLSMLLLVAIFPLLLATYLPGRIQATLKHPMLVAVKVWALAHLLVNGTLADVLLFGGFLVWAVADRISLKRRPVRPIPELPRGRFNDAIAVVGGLVIYGLFVVWLHPLLIGVPVM